MPAAASTCVSFANFSQVGEARLVIPPRLDAAEMPVVAVCADDVLAFAKRLVGDHLDAGADRTDRAAFGAESLADLLLLCRAKVFAERGQQLHFVEAVVAAHQREQHAPVRDDP